MKILINICYISLVLYIHLSLVTAQETMQDQRSDGSHVIETPEQVGGENGGQKRAASKLSVTHRDLLAEAWKVYRAKRYPEAKRLFQKAMQSKDAEVHNEALLGLGYTLKNTGKNAEARAIFGKLVQKDYRAAETVQALAELLFAAKDWKKSEELLGKMPHKERKKWRKKLESFKFQDEFERAKESRDKERLLAIVNTYQYLLEQCKFNDLFFVLALALSKSGAEHEASEAFSHLLVCHPRDWDFRITVLRELIALLPFRSADAKLKQERQREELPAPYHGKLTEIEIELLNRRLIAADPDSPDYRASAERLIGLCPENDNARKGLAWSCYRAQDYQCALEHFSALYASDPHKEEYLLACCYALEKLGRGQEAINPLEAWQGDMSSEIASVMHRLYRQKGDLEYKKKNYAQAEHYLAKALEIDPGDEDAMSLIGWSRYHQGDLDGALNVFRKRYGASRSRESAGSVLTVLEKMGKEGQFLSELAAEQDPVLRNIAGDHFYQRENPIRAAQTFKSPDSCYYNCDTPWGELFGYYRHRDGDAGLSKLTELAFPARFHYPMQYGREWVVNITPKYLDAGDTPSEPYAGKFYRSLEDPNVKPDSFDDSLWVWEPEVGYNVEGVVNYEFRLGATPIGGAVDPMVRFLAQASKKHEWHANLHQCSVEESILSYVGQTDPYGTKKWGRVLKTGIEGGRTFALHPPYWFSLDLGYDYYWGKDVKENYSIFGTASAGKTQPFWDGDLSYGLFFSSKHFRRNTDFFTFGHGGYFSPDIFYIFGPFLRYATEYCRDYWFDGQVSLGYMNYETEHAPHYHETHDMSSILNESAGNDFTGRYEGETESGLGVAVKLQGLRFVNDHTAVGGGVSLDSTSEYTEWQALLTLRLYFQPRKKLCCTKDLFKTVLP